MRYKCAALGNSQSNYFQQYRAINHHAHRRKFSTRLSSVVFCHITNRKWSGYVSAEGMIFLHKPKYVSIFQLMAWCIYDKNSYSIYQQAMVFPPDSLGLKTIEKDTNKYIYVFILRGAFLSWIDCTFEQWMIIDFLTATEGHFPSMTCRWYATKWNPS